ncbi:MAG: amidohydrolase family protein [Phycisphaeraceae bacterium]|nr:amidohydrolase family protein [Phycisphaeraceae bacterium]
MKHARPTVLYAAAVRDAMGVNASPGAVLVQDGRVVAAGEPESLPAELVEQAEVIDRPNGLLLPAMVNAHTHLELTAVGPQPYEPAGGFVNWVRDLRLRLDAIIGQDIDAKDIFPDNHAGWLRAWFRESATQGIRLAVTSGVQLVGDICTDQDIHDLIQRRGSGLFGIAHSEVFGLGRNRHRDFNTFHSYAKGIQPHAPYSAGPELYAAAARAAVEQDRPVCTHLAETSEEHQFIASGDGPWLDYHKEIGTWEEEFAAFYGQGETPVRWMQPYLQTVANVGGWLVAHCNYVSEDDIAILADTNTSVAYCPLASEYFGHKDHRYGDMLAAGINVCLGTDSIIGTDPNDPQPLGLLSTMRRLYERDQTDPDMLLAMATVHGARALRLGDKIATLQPGAPARFACLPIDPASETDPLIQVLTRQDPVEAISFD